MCLCVRRFGSRYCKVWVMRNTVHDGKQCGMNVRMHVHSVVQQSARPAGLEEDERLRGAVSVANAMRVRCTRARSKQRTASVARRAARCKAVASADALAPREARCVAGTRRGRRHNGGALARRRRRRERTVRLRQLRSGRFERAQHCYQSVKR